MLQYRCPFAGGFGTTGMRLSGMQVTDGREYSAEAAPGGALDGGRPGRGGRAVLRTAPEVLWSADDVRERLAFGQEGGGSGGVVGARGAARRWRRAGRAERVDVWGRVGWGGIRHAYRARTRPGAGAPADRGLRARGADGTGRPVLSSVSPRGDDDGGDGRWVTNPPFLWAGDVARRRSSGECPRRHRAPGRSTRWRRPCRRSTCWS